MSQILSTGSGGGGGGVTSVTGTANEVTATPTTGAVVVSTPSTFIAPGSIESTTTLKADGNFTAASGQIVHVTTPGAYPYTTLSTDYDILVDSSVARTINLEATPATGQAYFIKDNVGSAATNNITIVPNAGNIDGAANYKITTNYGSVELIYNGTMWNVVAFGGGAGIVNSVTGTTNQVTVTPTSGAVIVSTPSTFIAPGTIASTTTITSGTSMASTTILSAGGQFRASNGSVGSPGISFTSTTNCGLSTDGGGDRLEVSVGGGSMITIQSGQTVINNKFQTTSISSAQFFGGVLFSQRTPGAYPYTTLNTDFYVIVDTSSARTINLLASPETGRSYLIKDNTGSAATNNITIVPNAGNIDGAANYKITTNFGAVWIIYNGTQWNVV